MEIPVSVSEILEVRGSPLTEEEIWAILTAGARPLQALADHDSTTAGCIIPDSVFLLPDGSIRIQEVGMGEPGATEAFLPPEFSSSDPKDLGNIHLRDEMEKAKVYSLGACLRFGVSYGGPGGGSGLEGLSPDLLSLLNLMTVPDWSTRPRISRLSQMAKGNMDKRKLDAGVIVKDLYTSIMGSQSDISSPILGLSPEPILGAQPSHSPPSPPSHSPSPNDPPQSPPAHPLTQGRERSSSEDPSIKHGTNQSSGSTAPSALSSAYMYSDESEEEDKHDSPIAHEVPVTSDIPTSPDQQKSVVSNSELSENKTEALDKFPLENSAQSEDETPGLAKSDEIRISKNSVNSIKDTDEKTFDEEFPQSAFDQIPVPANIPDEFTNPKDHGKLEDSRSFHSLNCEFCSPQKRAIHVKEEKTRGSLTNMVPVLQHEPSCPHYTDPENEGQSNPISSDEVKHEIFTSDRRFHDSEKSSDDPFASFEELGKPAPGISSTQRQPSENSLVKTEEKREEAVVSVEEVVLEKDEDGLVLREKESETDAKTDSVEFMTKPIPRARKSLATSDSDEDEPTPLPEPQDLPPISSSRSSFSRTAPGRVSGSRISARRRQQQGSLRSAARMSSRTAKGQREMAVDDGRSFTPTGPKDGVESAEDADMTPKMSGPEFLHKSRLPSIRVKAPSRKKTKILGRSEASQLQVILLSGQRVEVGCRTDSTAGDVFEAVVTHTALTEHFFFGLTVLRDGEHFFLEPEDKLHKTAPPGWRNHRKQIAARNVYTLYLRLKYYPTTLDFIKTEHTMHEMYLQLRRDVIDERLQTERDAAFQLAALALQAEYGERKGGRTDYFHLDHYLPHRHLMEDLSGEERLKGVLAEMHAQHYSGIRKREAEAEYLKMCQKQREYGIHFYRMYRTKPSQNLTPSPLGDPDTGTPLWIGIMPRGIIVFEESSGERVPISHHPWHKTQSLQFDRKRFVIFSQAEGTEEGYKPPPHKTTFFSDDYKKSSYFVKFSSTQHKFCIKMRGWAANLAADPNKREGVSTIQRLTAPPANGHSLSNKSSTDSGAHDMGSREASPDEKILAAQNPSPQFHKTPVPPPRGRAGSRSDVHEDSQPQLKTPFVDEPSRDRTDLEITNDSISTSLRERFDKAPVMSPVTNSSYTMFTVNLRKDPHLGLGLTLVDGEIQDMKGVYVKSLTPGGPAEYQGQLKIGDKITSVNNVNLDGKNRHDAVGLVKASEGTVKLEILRLHGLYSSSEESVAHSASSPSVPKPMASSTPGHPVARPRVRATSDVSHTDGKSSTLPIYSSQDIESALLAEIRAEEDTEKSAKTKSRTLPTTSDERDHLGLRPGPSRRSRGDSNLSHSSIATSSSVSSRTSGEFNLENYNHQLDPHLNGTSSHEMIDKYMNPSGDPEEETPKHSLINKTSPPTPQRLADETSKNSGGTSGMYVGLDSDSEEESGGVPSSQRPLGAGHTSSDDEKVEYGPGAAKYGYRPNGGEGSNSSGLPEFNSSGILGSPAGSAFLDQNSRDSGSLPDKKNRDWVDQITFDEKEDSESEDESEVEEVEVRLEKNEKGSLGIKIAGGSKGQNRVYVKALVGNPALSCPNIRPGDRLTSVNGENTRNCGHQEVVGLLKAAESPVTLTLSRKKMEDRRDSLSAHTPVTEILKVILEKPVEGSMGLSLARPSGGDGIYIRVISSKSVAAMDGRLKVGDRLWEINGESVAHASPLEVVEKLKAAEGFVEVVVQREKKGN